MFRKIFFITIAIFFLIYIFPSCKDNMLDPYIEADVKLEDNENYIDSIIFLGESTTYHLKSRGVLSGGTQTKQVWAPKSGTLMLDFSTDNCRIVYPETGEEIDISEAMRRKKPKYIMLTFGLNGATKTISRGYGYFSTCYLDLIKALKTASPDTKIIIQSCFPVAKSMNTDNYSVDVKTLNSYINVINDWAQEIASSQKIKFVNSAEVLKDSEGFLCEKYQVGDGYHLTKEAYIEILKYIKTH